MNDFETYVVEDGEYEGLQLLAVLHCHRCFNVMSNMYLAACTFCGATSEPDGLEEHALTVRETAAICSVLN